MKTKRLVLVLTLFMGMMLSLMWSLGFSITSRVYADSNTVDTFDDEYDTGAACSLREAIQAANTGADFGGCTGDAGPDTIELPAGIYTLTLGTANENANAAGDLDINSTAPLTIVGAGAGQTIINANGLDRVFDLRPSASTVVISGVTVMGGYLSGSDAAGAGGGIYNTEAALTLAQVHLMDNRASTDGGGLYVYTGTTVLHGTQVSSNTAGDNGGGLYVYSGTMMLHGTRVFSNATGEYRGGGGLYVRTGSAVLSGTHVFSNAAGSGGGLYVYAGGAMVLRNTQVSSNVASYSSGGGAGLYVTAGSVVLSDTQVFSNYTAGAGGGLSINGSSRAVLSGTQVFNNNADATGGGLYSHESSVVLSGTQVFQNHAKSSGGGLYVRYNSSAMLYDAQVSDNTSGGEGGGVRIDDGSSATLRGTQVSNNWAAKDGGGVSVNDGHVVLRDAQVSNNRTSDYGGGLYIYSGTVALRGGQIVRNRASDEGGGLFIRAGNAVLSETQVLSNTASGTGGGGLSIFYSSAVLSGTQVLGNVSKGDGGGINVIEGSSLVMRGGQIARNEAGEAYGYGGGLYIRDISAELHGTQVFSNTAANGGGACVYEGTMGLYGTSVFSNAATINGGGISAVYGGRVVLSDTQVSHNTADDGGGGLFVNEGHAVLSSTSVFSNAAGKQGSGLYNNGTMTCTTSLTLSNDIYQAAGVFEARDDALHVAGDLTLAGGVFEAPATLTLRGIFSHTGGAYHQTQDVNGSSDVGFPKSGGLLINANGQDLGRTEVLLTAGAGCPGESSGESVRRCTLITPTTATERDASLTLFYLSGEIPVGDACDTIMAYRWDGTWDNLLKLDRNYGIYGRQCGSNPLSLQVRDVRDFSPFVLRSADDSDRDADGASDARDLCPGTTTGLDVDSFGCSTVAAIVAASNDPADGGFDADDLTDMGLVNVQPAKLDDYEVAITNEIPVPTILSDLQAIIDRVNTPSTPYTLTTHSVGQGKVTRAPSQTTYLSGTRVTLTATAASGWQFDQWSGALSGSTNPTQITMTADRIITATFSQITATTICTASESGPWSVVFATCPLDAKRVILDGVVVTLDVDAEFSGDFDARGTLDPTTHTITLMGSLDQTLSGNLTFYNLFINKDAPTDSVLVADKLAVAKKLTVQRGRLRSASVYGDVEIGPEGTLELWDDITVSGDWTNNGTFIAHTYTVTFITPNLHTISGTQVSAFYGLVISPTAPVFLYTTPTVTDTFTNRGTVSQTQTVNNGSAAFLMLNDPAGAIKYQGAVLTTTDDLGAVSVAMQGHALECPLDDGKVPYRDRCIRIITANGNTDSATEVTLYTTAYEDDVPVAEDLYHYQEAFRMWAGTAATCGMEAGAPCTADSVTLQAGVNHCLLGAAEAPPTHALTVNVAGEGQVTRVPSRTAYFEGSRVRLTAQPASGWGFTGWSGALSGALNPAELLMTEPKTVTATFEVPHVETYYTLTLNVVGQGVVSRRVPTGTVALPTASRFLSGTVLTLTAHPARGWTFQAWSGALTGAVNPAQITMSANREVTATFMARSVYLPLVIRKTS